MKTIIAGSRTITDYSIVAKAVADSGFQITEVVSGHAIGVDQLGERWANNNGIPIKMFKAEWGSRGKKAGLLRNIEMAKYSDQLIAIHAFSSKGTAHMIQTAEDFGLKIFVVKISKEEVQQKKEFLGY